MQSLSFSFYHQLNFFYHYDYENKMRIMIIIASILAFTALQLKGIKSKFVFLPDQNHWVLTAQDALVWQHEFYKWLEETLK